jgi:glycosyltransferase involved in cell wall biosynthesis
MNRFRVLHLITHLEMGGAQENTLLTVEGLDSDRFEVHIASTPGGQWESRARAAAGHFFGIPSMKRGIFPLGNGRAFFEILRLLRNQRYHIVHTHSTNAGILGRVAARVARIPIVVHTVHGFPFDDLTFSPMIRATLLHLERFCARLSDKLLMVSDLNKLQALKSRIAPAKKCVVIHSGIDMRLFETKENTRFARLRFGLHDRWPIVGWVGRLCEQNAPEVFVRAARRVLQDRPNTYFIVVGDGHLRPNVEKLMGGFSQIKTLGYRQDVPQLLPLFDIFVSTVRWAGLGRALTEAMIAGRPVIATSVNGVPEIVLHGKTGLLVQPDDPDAVAEWVCYVLDHPDISAQLGCAAKALVVPEFSSDLMVQRITKLYDDLLASKGLA